MTTDDQLGAAVHRLVGQVAHWTPSRWAASSAVAGRSRAEAFHAALQTMADAAARAEGAPPRPVPRLDNDLALPDQLRVLATDLTRHAPGAVPAAVEAVTALRHTLRPTSGGPAGPGG
ncbi:hypothetical protein KZZ52_55655 [Dactylosporangium sp. AC04546]|uniref:hypothetical protein n=1 Tax=Dactylosporangium sp. AC04546 TaxID=2862460 RepID=UPI001EE11AA2|nr:hypothetical protein [Dactylosporangium sp. AC04546]WVK83063.1 hypothetical protein KZZ52_55655 [Dactylosporangium sp. AC04546]